jgi:hypothetical protein
MRRWLARRLRLWAQRLDPWVGTWSLDGVSGFLDYEPMQLPRSSERSIRERIWGP